MKKLINNITISMIESAGVVTLLIAILQTVTIILTTQTIEEIGYKLLPIIAGFGWFGSWAILWSKNARKNITSKEISSSEGDNQ